MGWPIGFCRRPQRSSRTRVRPISGNKAHRIRLALVWICLAVVGGCQGPSSGGPGQTVEHLSSQIRQLRERGLLLETENQALKRQLQTASNLPAETIARDFYRLQRVRLTRYTGFYDKDKDGAKEKLIVYVQPVDEAGDVVKAAGTVDVQIWDLSADPNRALLGQWHVKAQELHKMWFATLVTINYRLMFDRPQAVPNERPLTVKVVFTDGLSGQVFTDQIVI